MTRCQFRSKDDDLVKVHLVLGPFPSYFPQSRDTDNQRQAILSLSLSTWI
jgi:hypothetical protein